MSDNNYIEFKQQSSVDKKYLVLENIQLNNVIDYQLKMMQYNKIQGLIPIEVDIKEDSMNLYYDITHASPLCEYIKERSIDKDEYKSLITKIIRVIYNSSSYLLHDNRFIFNSEQVYIDKKDGSPYFIYLPLKYIGEYNYSWQQVVSFINNGNLTDNLLELSQKVDRVLKESNLTLNKLKYIIDEKDKLKLIEYKEETEQQNIVEETIQKKENTNTKLIVVLIQFLFLLIFIYLLSSGVVGGNFLNVIGVYLLLAAIDGLILIKLLKKDTKTLLTKGKFNEKRTIETKRDKYTIDKKIPEYTQQQSKKLGVELYKEKGDYYIIFK